MIGSAGMLTLVTLTGLVAGLGREWLLVDAWGAGARTDGFLVALFIPEALRTMLAGGLLSSALMASWQTRDDAQRRDWLGALSVGLALSGMLLAWVLGLGAAWLTPLIGPGLSSSRVPMVAQSLSLLAWTLPAMLLQALWSVSLQARGRFVLPGFASLIFNLPAVAWLAWHRQGADELQLAQAFVVGAWATALVMVPGVWKQGLTWPSWRSCLTAMGEAGRLAAPLFGSAAGGQALMLLERMVATWLGEGVLTVLNLARKLINLPLVALMSVNQVVLSLMSRSSAADRLQVLRQGLALNTVIATPAAIAMLLASPAAMVLLFPRVQGLASVDAVLAWYSVALVLAGWNTMLARYNHATGDTRLPFLCETLGNVANAVALPLLAWRFGVAGLAAALVLGTVVNGALLVHHNRLWGRVRLPLLVGAGFLPVVLSAWPLHAWLPTEPPARLMATLGVAVCWAGGLAIVLRPWKRGEGNPAGSVSGAAGKGFFSNRRRI